MTVKLSAVQTVKVRRPIVRHLLKGPFPKSAPLHPFRSSPPHLLHLALNVVAHQVSNQVLHKGSERFHRSRQGDHHQSYKQLQYCHHCVLLVSFSGCVSHPRCLSTVSDWISVHFNKWPREKVALTTFLPLLQSEALL